MDTSPIDLKRLEAHKRVREAYGTAYIFRRRARFYRNGQRLIAFLGIALPILVGGAVMSFANYQSFLPFILPLIGVAALSQLILSAWSIVFKWDDAYENAVKSRDRSGELEFKWQTLADASPDQLEKSYDELRWETTKQAEIDEKESVSEKERSRGMCAALFKFRTACAVCGLVPEAIEPSDCKCCGNF